jgi:hypothetical protein
MTATEHIQLLQDAIEDALRRPVARELREQHREAIFAIHLTVGTSRLGDAIRVEQDAITGLKA